HEIPEEPAAAHLPTGDGQAMLRELIETSARLFSDHPVVNKHLDQGKNPPTQIWLWGQGHAPNLPSFVERFGVKSGCMITGVDLLRGLANLLGWDVHEVEGMT